MDDVFPVAWGSITGGEIHDAGGREGVGMLLLSLENALNGPLMLSGKAGQSIDFIVLAVPTSNRGNVEQDFEARWGAGAVMN